MLPLPSTKTNDSERIGEWSVTTNTLIYVWTMRVELRVPPLVSGEHEVRDYELAVLCARDAGVSVELQAKFAEELVDDALEYDPHGRIPMPASIVLLVVDLGGDHRLLPGTPVTHGAVHQARVLTVHVRVR